MQQRSASDNGIFSLANEKEMFHFLLGLSFNRSAENARFDCSSNELLNESEESRVEGKLSANHRIRETAQHNSDEPRNSPRSF
jgi:hypothetical protein